MEKIKKHIFLAITFVIAGLLIASTISIPAIKINKNENEIKIEKIQSELKTATLKYKSYNDRLTVVPRTTAIPEFQFEGDQLHPAFDIGETGVFMAAYSDEEFENIMWTYTNENAVYYNVEGGDFPSIKLWDGIRFFGTFVPHPDDSYGGIIYLFETTDPTDWDNQYSLVGWDWSENPNYPGELLWHDIIDMEIACDNSKENWEWGFVSLISDSDYTDDPLEKAPFISYQTSEDGFATISWSLRKDGTQIEGCEHTDNVIDPVTLETYAVYDIYTSRETAPYYGLFIRKDYYDDWDKDGAGYIYTMDGNLKYPAVTSNDGNVVVVMETDEEGNEDIICMYGSYIEDLDTSVVVDSEDDERYPEIAHLTGDTYVCTFTKNGNMYGVITENAGQTWGDPFQINDNNGAVIAEYKYSDLASNGLQAMWQEEDYESDIWYGSSTGNEPPQAPSINGPSSGKPNNNYDFTFTTTDPESDQVYYYVDWGDGTNSGWDGPHNSGASATLSHTWAEEQEFTITARAKDAIGNIGPDSTYPFSTPKNKAIIWSVLEIFPFLSQFLKALIL
jgi:hypothetical protein